MGLRDWFSKEAKTNRSVERWGKRLGEKYLQTQERKRAIDALAEIGTEEAVVALLKRYQFRIDSTIADEDEKQHVYDVIVALGRGAVPGILAYIRTDPAVYWPLKALRTIVGDEETVTHLLATMDSIEDTYGVNRDRMQQLVDNLREYAEDPRVYQRLLVLVNDEDEDNVLRAIDGLAARKGDPSVPDTIVPLLLKPETSYRLRTLIMELMLEQEWNVKKFKKQLTGQIPETYWIDDTGVVRRK